MIDCIGIYLLPFFVPVCSATIRLVYWVLRSVCVSASVAPSLIIMIALLGLLKRYRNPPRVKRLTRIIRPTIAVLLGVMTIEFFGDSYMEIGWIHTVIVIIASYVLLEKRRGWLLRFFVSTYCRLCLVAILIYLKYNKRQIIS